MINSCNKDVINDVDFVIKHGVLPADNSHTFFRYPCCIKNEYHIGVIVYVRMYG